MVKNKMFDGTLLGVKKRSIMKVNNFGQKVSKIKSVLDVPPAS